MVVGNADDSAIVEQCDKDQCNDRHAPEAWPSIWVLSLVKLVRVQC
jgi:hypothetical protein